MSHYRTHFRLSPLQDWIGCLNVTHTPFLTSLAGGQGLGIQERDEPLNKVALGSMWSKTGVRKV